LIVGWLTPIRAIQHMVGLGKYIYEVKQMVWYAA